MDYSKSTEVRTDIEATEGDARFTARIFEGVVTIGLSGTAATPSQIAVPHEDLPALAEFISHVLTEAPAPVSPEPTPPA